MQDELKSSFPRLPYSPDLYSEDQGKRFVRDIKRRYQERWDVNMPTDYCWMLRRGTEDSKRKHFRGASKRRRKGFTDKKSKRVVLNIS
ncbi:hypothetical protein AVEN_205207-1 [Araneus ventricosus]|uniref:Uncharacterized protein n=1 Tax=Araneus ventricosus TaxID=182803 RepID=A0A4Y2VLK1_ARAVE|nr:hypothetical protein AVEN_205207-1 [Araneus ventricosus]